MKQSYFQTWFKGLEPHEKVAYVSRVGITMGAMATNYLRPLSKLPTHDKQLKSTRAQPPSSTMLRMARASRGYVLYDGMLDHFYRK